MHCETIFAASTRPRRGSCSSMLRPLSWARFPESLQRRAMQDLEDIGVEIHLGTAVTHVDQYGLETNATDPSLRRIEAATKIWAAGVQASPLGRILADAAGAEVDRSGRVKVETTAHSWAARKCSWSAT